MTDRSFLSVIVFCIRNPLIFQGKSLLAHVWTGHKYKPFIVQARTGFVFMTLISYQKKEKDNSKTASFSFRKTMSFYF